MKVSYLLDILVGLVSVISMSCLLVRSARRSLSACPQFLVDFGGMGKVWDVGCVLWCVGGPAVQWASWNGKNDGITISITNAGAKSPTLKNGIKSPSRQVGRLCHLDLVSMNFTDSHIGACHLGKMDFSCHLAKMARVVKMAPAFVT